MKDWVSVGQAAAAALKATLDNLTAELRAAEQKLNASDDLDDGTENAVILAQVRLATIEALIEHLYGSLDPLIDDEEDDLE